jgi:hypothetical protein
MTYKHFAVIIAFLLAIPVTAIEIKDGIEIEESCDMSSVEGNICLITNKAKKAGIDVETALAIAKCESGHKHYDERTGEVLRGKVNPDDTGIFQINSYWHKAEARRLGYDIYDKEDNIDYAMFVMKNQGFSPWNCYKG